MTKQRQCRAKIVATLGPASSSPEMIRALVDAGADVFRLNFSHGSHDEHRARYDIIRTIEQEIGRPIGVLADLQGPKLRVGRLASGPLLLAAGERVRFDLDPAPGRAGAGAAAAPGDLRGPGARRPAAARRRQDPARGRGRPGRRAPPPGCWSAGRSPTARG